MKKLLIITLALILTLSAAVIAHADEAEGITPTSTDGPTEELEAEDKGAKAEDNVFGAIYNTVKENADKLFSALAFSGTLIIAFAYKKGLIPLLEKALSKIGSEAGRVKEAAEKNSDLSAQGFRDMIKHLESVSLAVEKLSESIVDTREKLDKLSGEENERAALRTVLSGQIDLLYDVFMSSSLPQYSKDAVGERVSAMRATLKAVEKSE